MVTLFILGLVIGILFCLAIIYSGLRKNIPSSDDYLDNCPIDARSIALAIELGEMKLIEETGDKSMMYKSDELAIGFARPGKRFTNDKTGSNNLFILIDDESSYHKIDNRIIDYFKKAHENYLKEKVRNKMADVSYKRADALIKELENDKLK